MPDQKVTSSSSGIEERGVDSASTEDSAIATRHDDAAAQPAGSGERKAVAGAEGLLLTLPTTMLQMAIAFGVMVAGVVVGVQVQRALGFGEGYGFGVLFFFVIFAVGVSIYQVFFAALATGGAVLFLLDLLGLSFVEKMQKKMEEKMEKTRRDAISPWHVLGALLEVTVATPTGAVLGAVIGLLGDGVLRGLGVGALGGLVIGAMLGGLPLVLSRVKVKP